MTKSTNTKRALLLSVLSLFCCVAMFIGSTFAWFTDSATASVSSITSGKLDVELIDASSKQPVTEALSWVKAQGAPADEAVLWEPGCTYELPAVMVANKGNLALKYKLSIEVADGDKRLLDVIDFTVDGLSLDTENSLAKDETSAPIVVKAHMSEQAGNDYMGLSLNSVRLVVVATQDTVEFDSIDNKYDENAYYADYNAATVAELNTALAAAAYGDVVAVTEDISLDSAVTVPVGVTLIGKNNAVVTVQNDVTYPVTLSAGAKVDGLSFKMDEINTTEVDFVYMQTGASVTNCCFEGLFNGGSEVSRGIIMEAGVKDVVISGNTFKNLRQPAYVEGSGIIADNYVEGTRGFVVCSNSDFTFTGNSFGVNFADDFAIIYNNSDVDNYQDTKALSAANSNASVDNQVTAEAEDITKNYVDSAADLTAAIADNNGEIIALKPDVEYVGNFSIDKDIIINGNGAVVTNDGSANTFDVRSGVNAVIQNTKIESTNKKYGIHIQPGSGEVTIDGCEITGTTSTMGHSIWINGGNSSDVVIKNCTISRPVNLSGYNSSIKNVTIENNTFKNGFGVYAITLCGDLENIKISNNTYGFSGLARVHKDGADNFSFVNILIENNTSSSNTNKIVVDAEVEELYNAAVANGNVVIK